MNEKGGNNVKKRKAVILFADIMNSSELSNALSFKAYDEFVKEFQERMIDVLKKHIIEEREYCADNKRKFEASVRGDEVCLILYSNVDEKEEETYRKKDIKLSLLIAIDMKRRWFTGSKNVERIREGRSIVDIGIGINCGYVIVDDHLRIGTDGKIGSRETAEGYAINLAKRIEGYSRSGEYSKIFVSRSIYSALRIEFQIAFSHVHIVSFKGIAQTIPVYEIKSVGHVEDTAFAPSFSEEEETIYERAVEYNPHDLWLILDLAHCYFDKERYNKAVGKYRLAIEIDPEFAPAYMYLGRSFYRDLLDEEARPHLERARELNPDSTRANNFLAVCLRRLGYRLKQREEAGEAVVKGEWKSYYRRALELHKTAMRIVEEEPERYRWAFNAYALTLAQAVKEGVLEYTTRDKQAILDEALKNVNNVLALEKIEQANLFHHVKGFILAQKGEQRESIKEFNDAIECIKNDKEIASNKYREKMSEIYFHWGVLMGDNKFSNFKNTLKEALIGDLLRDKKPIRYRIQEEKSEREEFLRRQYWYKEVEDFLSRNRVDVTAFLEELENWKIEDEQSNQSDQQRIT